MYLVKYCQYDGGSSENIIKHPPKSETKLLAELIFAVAWSPVANPSNHYFHCLVWWLNYSADGFKWVAERERKKREKSAGRESQK